ncbi:MAG: hypothetical protein RIS43_457 [Actinomycetota bacterium]|jgi:carbonic anhydrase
MKIMTKRVLVAAAAVLIASVAPGAASVSATASWSYKGETGPAHWGELDPSFVTCVDGTAQSPINVTGAKKKALNNIKFNYVAGPAEVFNNGHTVEAEPAEDAAESTISLDGNVYPFLQFHFHAPSEHTVNGKRYPLEIHFVHKTETGKIAVVGVLVKAGKENAAWDKFVNSIPFATAEPADTPIRINWLKLLPKNRQTYRYNGSLTTPGCAEGVKWNLFSTPIEMSALQIESFRNAYAGNARPVQPLHGRTIYFDSTASK